MGFSLSRNRTYDKVAAGKLRNIRMHTVEMNLVLDESIANGTFDPYTGNPTAPYDGTAWEYPGGGWLLPNVGDYPDGSGGGWQAHWHNNTVDSFSAGIMIHDISL